MFSVISHVRTMKAMKTSAYLVTATCCSTALLGGGKHRALMIDCPESDGGLIVYEVTYVDYDSRENPLHEPLKSPHIDIAVLTS